MSGPYRSLVNDANPVKMQYIVLANRVHNNGMTVTTRLINISNGDTFSNLPDALTFAETINGDTTVVQVVAAVKAKTVHEISYV